MRRNQALLDTLNFWSYFPLLRRAKYRVEERIIQERCAYLFDAAFYLEANPGVLDSGMSPLRHFVRYGAAAGRDPHPLFNLDHYAATSGFRAGRANPLVHFHLIGRRLGLVPTPLFDYESYRDRHPDLRFFRTDLFHHFATVGIFENRIGIDRLQLRQYLGSESGKLEAGEASLYELVRTKAVLEQTGFAEPVAPVGQVAVQSMSGEVLLREILQFAAREGDGQPEVDIVIPVYKDFFVTLSCIRNALVARNLTAAAIVVIDDASPDPRIVEALDAIAAKGLITLARNERNLGFVKTANRGMRLHADRDVVLLNSDALVYGDWLDRLRRTAYARDDIATVTPLTNNGTICSYPHFVRENPEPADRSMEELDRIAAEANRGRFVEAPTAVGFCMYVKRALLNQIGYFDEAAFGAGYGEENDLCLRGQRAGWKDVIAADTMVYHFGSASFRTDKAKRVTEALSVIERKYPQYTSVVQDYIQQDPLQEIRANIDFGRLKQLKGSRNILVVSHFRGGGTEQNIQERCARFSREGVSVYRLYAMGEGSSSASICHADAVAMPNIPLFSMGDVADVERLANVCRELEISEIEIHHLVDFDAHAPLQFLEFSERAGIPFQFFVHDYLSICPRTNLAGADGMYCGEPDPEGCRSCLKRNGSEFDQPDIAEWRDGYRQLLSRATRVVAPSADTSRRLRRYFPQIDIAIEAHDQPTRAPYIRRPREERTRLRIGTIGAVSPIKGLHVLRECARIASARQLPVDFIVIGYTSDDVASRQAGLKVLGPYVNGAIQQKIRETRLDGLFLPSICPETYSYVLSIAMESGLPIFCFDIGALAERARGLENAKIFDLRDARNPDRLVAEFLNYYAEDPVAG